MGNKQSGVTGIAIVIVVLLVLATSGYFAWQHRTDQGTSELPGFISSIIVKEPNTEVKRCTQKDGKVYYWTDAVMMADEGNDIYTEAGVKVDSCFGFLSPDVISPFCKSFDTTNCTVMYTPVLPQAGEDGNFPILGNQEDLVSFSLTPGSSVSGKTTVTGSVEGGYFFEANILVNILDQNMNLLKVGYGMATTDWMTAGPVKFSANIDVTGLPKGFAYIELKQDDPSDGESGKPIKQIHIPIVIK